MLINPLESLIKHVFHEHVYPKPGSIVKCDLVGGLEHSGVYVGNGKIVELEGGGNIREISPDVFLNYSRQRTGISVYVACDLDGKVLHSQSIANRAKRMIGSKRDYDVIFDNCHQFTAGCITGDFNNGITTFGALEHLIDKEMNDGEFERKFSRYNMVAGIGCIPPMMNWLVMRES